MTRIDKVIQKVAIPVIALASGLLIVFYVSSAKETSHENNGYIRVINCIISENITTRTKTDIEQCYQTVEAQTGVHLQRYDTSSYGN
jgi:hypothetical protein